MSSRITRKEVEAYLDIWFFKSQKASLIYKNGHYAIKTKHNRWGDITRKPIVVGSLKKCYEYIVAYGKGFSAGYNSP